MEAPAGTALWDSVPENTCSQQKPNKTNLFAAKGSHSYLSHSPIPYRCLILRLFPAFTFPARLVEVVTTSAHTARIHTNALHECSKSSDFLDIPFSLCGVTLTAAVLMDENDFILRKMRLCTKTANFMVQFKKKNQEITKVIRNVCQHNVSNNW